MQKLRAIKESSKRQNGNNTSVWVATWQLPIGCFGRLLPCVSMHPCQLTSLWADFVADKYPRRAFRLFCLARVLTYTAKRRTLWRFLRRDRHAVVPLMHVSLRNLGVGRCHTRHAAGKARLILGLVRKELSGQACIQAALMERAPQESKQARMVCKSWRFA